MTETKLAQILETAAAAASLKCGTKDLTDVQREIKKYVSHIEKLMTKPMPSAAQVAAETSNIDAIYGRLTTAFETLEVLQEDVKSSYLSLKQINKLASDLEREVNQEIARLKGFSPYELVKGQEPRLTSEDLVFIVKELDLVDDIRDKQVVFPEPAEFPC